MRRRCGDSRKPGDTRCQPPGVRAFIRNSGTARRRRGRLARQGRGAVYPDAAAALGVPRRRAGATARAFSGGRVPLEQAHRDRVLELTALVARKQPQRYGPFAARWLCLYLEAHEKATPEDVELLVSSLRALATPKDHVSALAILRKVIRP